MIRRVGFGLGGGLLAGGLVGVAEALWVLSWARTGEYGALLVGLALYSAAGLVVGAAVGVGLAGLGRVWVGLGDAAAWSLGFAVSAIGLLGLVAWQTLARLDLGGGAAPSLAAALLALGAGLWWLGWIFVGRTRLLGLTRLRGAAGAWAALALLAALFSFSPGGGEGEGELAPLRERPPAGLSPDVLLVVVDGLRADHVGALGGPEGLTPRLDRLASEGITFEAAFSSSATTRPAFAALLAGAPGPTTGVRAPADGVGDAIETLGEVLQERGYATGMMPNSRELSRAWNVQQGFDWFAWRAPPPLAGVPESARHLVGYAALRAHLARGGLRAPEHYLPAAATIGPAQRFVDANADRPWLLVLHWMEPHPPWFGGDGALTAGEGSDGAKRAAYSEEVRAVDRALGALIDGLEAAGRADDLAIVVTANHGEELGDHGGWGHGATLYDEVLHVPLIVRLPGGGYAGARVPWQVGLIDVAPTVAVLAGAEVPDAWTGRDLLSSGFDEALAEVGLSPGFEAGDDVPDVDPAATVAERATPILAELRRGRFAVQALRVSGWKYIVTTGDPPRHLPEEALFHVADDPDEVESLAGVDGPRQAELSRQLRGALDVAESRGAAATRGAAEDR